MPNPVKSHKFSDFVEEVNLNKEKKIHTYVIARNKK